MAIYELMRTIFLFRYMGAEITCGSLSTMSPRHAGVSVRTVSRVLNNHPNVSRFTRERVLQAIEELNFVPNALARGLATQQSRTLGVIIPDVANLYFCRKSLEALKT